jgi:glycosyltransferase involved in cell wall biosynthesis
MPARLTVLLPTLNCDSYLLEALDSLAAQTFQDFKVLLLDGGSQDHTLHIARQYSRFPVEIVHCGPIGLGAQLRMGLALAETPLIARMDADDVSLPPRFERQVRALEHQPDLALVGCQIELLIGSHTCRAGILPWRHEDIRKLLWAGFPAFCHPAVMFRAESARRCSAYSISGIGEDLDFFLRMTEAGVGLNLKDVLYRYRFHPQSISLRSFGEVRKNYEFALECARARRRGLREPNYAEYLSFSNKRALRQNFAAKCECVGVALYRRSRMLLATGGRCKGVLGVMLSLALRPSLVFARLRVQIAALR